jgi:hypothetical protein
VGGGFCQRLVQIEPTLTQVVVVPAGPDSTRPRHGEGDGVLAEVPYAGQSQLAPEDLLACAGSESERLVDVVGRLIVLMLAELGHNLDDAG